MTRLIDVISLSLLTGAAVAFVFGLNALAGRRDLEALYSLIVGGLALKASTELLRPRAGAR
jgi:hypothetical protein